MGTWELTLRVDMENRLPLDHHKSHLQTRLEALEARQPHFLKKIVLKVKIFLLLDILH